MNRILNLLLLLLIIYTANAQQPKLVLPIGHTTMLTSAIFTPDGKKVITVSWDNTAKIWDATTGSLLATLKHKNRVLTASLSADGKKLVTAADDSTAKIWDIQTGDLLRSINVDWNLSFAIITSDGKKILTIASNKIVLWNVQTGRALKTIDGDLDIFTSAAFSPDDKKIVAIKYSNPTTEIWNIETGKLLTKLSGHIQEVNSVVFTPDGKKIISASDDNRAIVWSAETGHSLITVKHDNDISSASVSPDGKKITTASKDGTAKVWDIQTGKMLFTLRVDSDEVISAKFSLDGKRIVTTNSFYNSNLWNGSTGKLITVLNGHTASVLSSAFSADGKKIVTASGDRTAKIWDAQTGMLLSTLRGNTSPVRTAIFSSDGKKILTDFDDAHQRGYIWDAQTGILSGLVDGLENYLQWCELSPDKQLILRAQYLKDIELLDAKTGNLLAELKGHTNIAYTGSFSPDGKKIVSGGEDNTAKVWDTDKRSLLLNLQHSSAVMFTGFTPDGKKIITCSRNDTAKIWSAETGSLLLELYNPGDEHFLNWVLLAVFNHDGERVITMGNSTYARVWNVSTGKIITELNGHSDDVKSAAFSPDEKLIATCSTDNTAKLWNAETGALLFDLRGHDNVVNSVAFSPDGKYLVTTSDDNTIKKWDVATGKLLYTFFTVDYNDYFLQLPSGYYQSTSGAAKLLHYVTKDLKVISFQQLDIKYNRPDKILEIIDPVNTTLINAYRKAYYKRIKKLGVDTTSFRDGYSLPEADFVNRDAIEYEHKNNKLSLHIKGMDKTYMLDRFNVWVNEVPVYGLKGISIRRRKSNSFDTTVIINLSQGENRIETSVTNANGTESYRIPLNVKYIPTTPRGVKTVFIGIGINNFAEKKYNLQWSVKDIRDLAIKFKQKTNSNILIDTLFNENVTIENIKSLKKILLQTSEDDKVIIAYSGHGLLSKDYDYFLSTYNINFLQPQENGLPYDELESLMDSIPARKKLMLIDACHSGEVDKEELTKMILVQKQLDNTKKGVNELVDTTRKTIGIKNSFELMQELFANVGKATGATIISAASGTQFALERGDLENGVFTFSILEAMNQYIDVSVNQLKTLIGARVEQLTNGQQKPTSRNETLEYDWNVW